MMDKPDNSFSVKGGDKGSYRRMTEDIARALDVLRADEMLPPAAFIYYYFGCEKLVRIMGGLASGKIAKEKFGRSGQTPGFDEIKKLVRYFDFPISDQELGLIFDKSDKESARLLRDQFVHEIGPSHAKKLVARAPDLIPVMKKFLDSSTAVITFIEKQYGNTRPGG